jgi:hypothetical protein
MRVVFLVCVFQLGFGLSLTTGPRPSLQIGAVAQAAEPTGDLPTRVERLEDQLDDLKGNVSGLGGLAFLFGVVCALWAQNTNRNPWLWFFLGAIFSAITAVVMLVKNANDRRDGRPHVIYTPPPQ